MKVFGKWDSKEVVVTDLGLARYVGLSPRHSVHTFGSHVGRAFGAKELNIVERFANKLMRSGQGKRKLGGHYIRGKKATGKKLMILKALDLAFDKIAAETKKNPIQVLVDATQKSSPNEDVTRLKKGGVAYTESVDVSPYGKLSESLKNLALAVFANTFNKNNNLSDVIAEELILASTGDQKSYAVKRKDEIERIAKASR